MEYKKLSFDNYEEQIITTDRFKTNNITIYFTKKFNKNDRAVSNILAKLLVYTTKKYNTKIKLARKLEDLYLTNIYSNFERNGNIETLSFSLDYIDPKYTDSKMIKQNIDLLFEILLNPNIDKNKFNKEDFDICKNIIIENIKAQKENSYIYSYLNFLKHFNEGYPSTYSIFGDLKDYETIDNKVLYNFYKRLFEDYKINVILIGNIDTKTINYFNQKMEVFKNPNPKIKDIVITKENKEKVKIIKEESKFNQSQLFLGFNLKNLNDFEKNYVLILFNIIFGSGSINNLLFNTVREKNGLCYSISSDIVKNDNILMVEAGINKKNYQKSLNLIKKTFNLMKDEKIIKKYLLPAVNTVDTSFNYFYDNKEIIKIHYFTKNFLDLDSVEERRKTIKRVTAKDIVSLHKKIKLDTIYFLEGNNEDGNS